MPERRPYGTPGEILDFAYPTLKRGANIHSAYGASNEQQLSGRCYEGPFEGPLTQIPPALSGDTCTPRLLETDPR
jgi:hypothetical protein